MSRSGYSDEGDYDTWAMIRWRGAVASAVRGKKGQAFFKELVAALDAMPEKRLVAEDLITETGEVCALGALGKARGIDMKNIDPEDYYQVAGVFDINEKLVQETVWMNDDAISRYRYVHNPKTGNYDRSETTPEYRWEKMRAWAAGNIK